MLHGFVIVLSAPGCVLECFNFDAYNTHAVEDRLNAMTASGRRPLMFARVFTCYDGANIQDLIVKFVHDIDLLGPVGTSVNESAQWWCVIVLWSRVAPHPAKCACPISVQVDDILSIRVKLLRIELNSGHLHQFLDSEIMRSAPSTPTAHQIVTPTIVPLAPLKIAPLHVKPTTTCQDNCCKRRLLFAN